MRTIHQMCFLLGLALVLAGNSFATEQPLGPNFGEQLRRLENAIHEETAAQDPDQRSSKRRWSEGPPYLLHPPRENRFFLRLWRDFVIQAGEPFRYAKAHPWRFAAGVGVAGGLIASDEYLFENLQLGSRHWRGDEMEVLSDVLSKYGDFYYLVPIYAGFGLHAWLGKSDESVETIRLLTEAYVTTSAWAGLLKFAVGRERPLEAGDETWDYHPFQILRPNERKERWKTMSSFPSGHTSTAFATATILAYRYPRYGIVPVLAFSSASLIGLSRVTEKAHWPSDVAIAAALGYFCARQVLRDNRGIPERRKRVQITGLELSVGQDRFQVGVSLALP